jgi:hypothetical protein
VLSDATESPLLEQVPLEIRFLMPIAAVVRKIISRPLRSSVIRKIFGVDLRRAKEEAFV